MSLVLSRKKSETVVVFDPATDFKVVVSVAEIRGDKVRIGFIAPPNVLIQRQEIYDAIQRKSQAA